MRKIHSQTQSLPKDWIEQVKNFDITNSPLNEVEKLFAYRAVQYILFEKEKSLHDRLIHAFIDYIFFKQQFLPSTYSKLPIELVQDVLSETDGEVGLNFSRKLHSVFIELLTYNKLVDQGYMISDFKRKRGSCDLIMNKDGHIYNFEVKFKESPDIQLSRFYDYLDGMTLLDEYNFLRGRTVDTTLKVDSITYSNQDGILKDFDEFLKRKEEKFDGKYVQIYTYPDGLHELRKENLLHDTTYSKLLIQDTLKHEKNAESLIISLFLREGGHIETLKNKSEKFENFKGCLSWHIPFHHGVDYDVIEKTFNKLLKLDFDLYVFLSNLTEGEHDFIVYSS